MFDDAPKYVAKVRCASSVTNTRHCPVASTFADCCFGCCFGVSNMQAIPLCSIEARKSSPSSSLPTLPTKAQLPAPSLPNSASVLLQEPPADTLDILAPSSLSAVRKPSRRTRSHNVICPFAKPCSVNNASPTEKLTSTSACPIPNTSYFTCVMPLVSCFCVMLLCHAFVSASPLRAIIVKS